MHPGFCDGGIDLQILQKNRVSGGSAPIHSALSGGANHIVTACHSPRPIQCLAIMQFKHWALTQRPFFRNPKSSPDAGSFNCTACDIMPRHESRSDISHIKPIKAYYADQGAYLFDLRGLIGLFGAFSDAVPITAPLRSCWSAAYLWRDTSDTYGLESKAVKLFSFMQLMTRQSIYIIIIVICSFRSSRSSVESVKPNRMN